MTGKLFKKITMLLMLVFVISPTLSPLMFNGQEVYEDITLKNNEKKEDKGKKSEKEMGEITRVKNVAYGCDDSDCDNGVGIGDLSTVPSYYFVYNIEFKIDALTHEVVMKLQTSRNIFDDTGMFSLKIEDENGNSRVIDEENTDSDSEEGYIKDIDTPDIPLLYEIEISTGILDEFYGSTQNFRRYGKYTISFVNEDSGSVEEVPVLLDDLTNSPNMQVSVPRSKLYKGKVYSIIGDNINQEIDLTGVSDIEKVSVGSTIVDGKSKFGVYEFESICYEDLNTDKIDWSEDDLTLAKYDHVIRPCDGNYVIPVEIDASVTNEDPLEDGSEPLKADKDGGFSTWTDKNSNNIVDSGELTNDGLRPLGRSMTPDTVDTFEFKTELTGNGDEILGRSLDNGFIKNLYINLPTVDNVGLIQKTNAANINNLGLIDANVIGQNNVGTLAGQSKDSTFLNTYALEQTKDEIPDIRGKESVGGIVGSSNNDNFSSDSRILGEIPGWEDNGEQQPKATDPDRDGYKTFNTLGVFAENQGAGGIIGNANTSIVTNTYNKGNVSGKDMLGGIVGVNYGNSIISNTYNRGSIQGSNMLGGIVGHVKTNGLDIHRVYNTGDIHNENSRYVGGIVGKIDDSTSLKIQHVYNIGGIGALQYGAGIVGYGNVILSYSYNLGVIEVLKDSLGEYLDKPYMSGIVGAFGPNPIESKISHTMSSGNIKYTIDFVNRPNILYVGKTIGQPKGDVAYTTPYIDISNVYALEGIDLPISADLDYNIPKETILNSSQYDFWTTNLGFDESVWNLKTMPVPNPDSDPNDESSDDTLEVINDLGYYGHLKEERTDGVEVEVAEQKATALYRNIEDYKINAMTLDIDIKYEDLYSTELKESDVRLVKQGFFKETELACSPADDINNKVLTFTGSDCGIEADTDYKVYVDGLLNEELYLYIHTPKQYIDDNSTPEDESDDTVYALVGDSINEDTYKGVDGNAKYNNQNGVAMPSTAPKSTLDTSKNSYGIYELESICYEEAADKAGDSTSYYPIMRGKNEWTQDDLTISKYDHIVRPCDGNYMIVGDVDATITNEDPKGDGSGTLTLDRDGGFSQVDSKTSITADANNGFNPIGLYNSYYGKNSPSIEFKGKIIGVEDEEGTENIIEIINLFISDDKKSKQAFISTASSAIVKSVGLLNLNAMFDSSSGGLISDSEKSTIKNCYVENAQIKGSGEVGGLIGSSNRDAIENSFFNGQITSRAYQIGGLIGSMDSGKISNSFAIANISNTADTHKGLGGLVGELKGYSGLIEDSYYFGKLEGGAEIGGIVGSNAGGSIINTYSHGYINENGLDSYDGGGLIGMQNKGNSINSSRGEINNSYSTMDISVMGPEAGALIGKWEYGDYTKISNSYAYDGQKVMINGEEIYKVIGTDTNFNDRDFYKSYSEITQKSFYETLGWSTDEWRLPTGGSYLNNPILKTSPSSSFFKRFESIQDENMSIKLEVNDITNKQVIDNFKVNADSDSIHLRLKDASSKGFTKSTQMNIEVVPQTGYTGGGIGGEKVMLGNEDDNYNYLYIDGDSYNIQPDSVYTVKITNSSLGIEDSFEIHTPLKNSDGFIPIGNETVSHTDVNNRFNTTTVLPESTRDVYNVYELESICYEHTGRYRAWKKSDLTLSKYDHVIRPCDADYILEKDIDMSIVNEDPLGDESGTLHPDKDGGFSTWDDKNKNNIVDSGELTNDGFRSISYYSGKLEGNNKTINNFYSTDSFIKRIVQRENANNTPSVRNLTMDNFLIDGRYARGIFEQVEGAVIDNIKILNGNVSSRTNNVGLLINISESSVISNVEIENANVKADSYISGFIQNSTSDKIFNIKLENTNITSDYTSQIDKVAGVISSVDKSNISNVSYKGEINLHTDGDVRSVSKGFGSLMYDSGIQNIYLEGDINIKAEGTSRVGGIVGGQYSTDNISNVYSIGDINIDALGGEKLQDIGGLFGTSYSYRDDSILFNSIYSEGDINIEASVPLSEKTQIENIGGQVGRFSPHTSSDLQNPLRNTFSVGNITYDEDNFEAINLGGLIGYDKTDNNLEGAHNMYVYEGNKMNGNLIQPNEYVGSTSDTYANIHTANKADLLNSNWYKNSGDVEGAGVNLDELDWDAPYVEGPNVCLPHLYDTSETNTYLPNQECIVIDSLKTFSNDTLNTFDLSGSQKQIKTMASANMSNKIDQEEEEVLLEEEQYPYLNEYVQANGFDFSELKTKRNEEVLQKIEKLLQRKDELSSETIQKIKYLLQNIEKLNK